MQFGVIAPSNISKYRKQNWADLCEKLAKTNLLKLLGRFSRWHTSLYVAAKPVLEQRDRRKYALRDKIKDVVISSPLALCRQIRF